MATSVRGDSHIGRRQLLKIGLTGTALLASAGGIATLSGCAADRPAESFVQLRDSDLPLLRRLIPVVLDGSLPTTDQQQAIDTILQSIDSALNHMPPHMLKQFMQLFDLLASSITRGPTTGVWRSWDKADDQTVQAFLQRWENSSFDLFQQGYNALTKPILIAWYTAPQSWGSCGYPGPPAI